MLCIGQERKAGLCCYAGVCYKNTTLRFQSRNTEQAPVPPSSCRTGSVAEGLGPQNPQGQGRCRRFSQRRAGGHTGPQEIPVGLNTAAQQPRCPLPLISLLLLPPNQINHHGGPALRRARAPPWQAARPPAAGPLAQPRPAGLGPPDTQGQEMAAMVTTATQAGLHAMEAAEGKDPRCWGGASNSRPCTF